MSRSVSRFAFIVAAIAAPVAAHGQAPWRQVYKDADLTVILDTASISLESPGTWNTVTSWDYKQPRVLESKKHYTRLVERAYVRCSPARVKRVRSTLYIGNNTLVKDEGEVDSRDEAHMVWDRPRARTPGRSVFESVCRIVAGRSGAKGSTPAAKATHKKAVVRKRTVK